MSGDRIAGPLRPPRRSERFPSLVRVDTINGRPADEVAEGTRFEDLPVAFPAERFELGSEDPTVKAIEWLTPFGKGSRVVLAGPARAGKSEALRRLAEALGAIEGLEVSLVLAGVRPEELGETGGVSFAASSDAQAQAVESGGRAGPPRRGPRRRRRRAHRHARVPAAAAPRAARWRRRATSSTVGR